MLFETVKIWVTVPLCTITYLSQASSSKRFLKPQFGSRNFGQWSRRLLTQRLYGWSEIPQSLGHWQRLQRKEKRSLWGWWTNKRVKAKGFTVWKLEHFYVKSILKVTKSAILTDFKALNDLLVMKKKNLNLHTVKSLGGATTFPINSSL